MSSGLRGKAQALLGRGLGLHVRLLLLVILAAAPALAILSFQAISSYREGRELARERGLTAARAAADAYADALGAGEMLLVIAANLRGASPESPEECVEALRSLWHAAYATGAGAQFTSVFAASPDGEIYCSSAPRGESGYGDRAYFQQALQSGAFVVGEHVLGRRSGEMLIPLALPKLSPQGTVSSVFVTGLRLGWLGQTSVLQPPPGAVVTLLNDDGAILARSHDHANWVGRSFPWLDRLRGSLNSMGEGFAERIGADGIDRLYTFKRFEIGPNPFYLLVGYETADVLGPANRRLVTGLAFVAAAALLVLGVASYGARRFILEPVQGLARAANRMAAGDLDVRVMLPSGSDLAELGAAFNGMAVSLQARAVELSDSNDMLSAIVSSSPFAIFAVDAETRVLSWNPACERLFGWPNSEILGRLYPAVPDDQRESFLAMRQRALSGEGVHEYEAERIRKDGRRILMRFSVAPLRSPEGDLRGTLYVGEDVTERRSLERQLMQAQKMEAVGQLTGGIAHDFNNLLQVILGCIDLLFERLTKGSGEAELAAMIRSAAERGATLTKQLLAFSRRQTLEPEQLDVNEVVQELDLMLRRTLGGAVGLETSLAPALHPTFVDRGQLESALLNLAINARDAMPEGGRLTLETANVELDEDYAARRVEVTPGEYVMISVSDTGVGMTPEVLSRVFEPFFTTKPVGKGSGLGLSMVFGFIKQSKGHVSAYSEPGHGATIRLYLPRAVGGGEVAARGQAEPIARTVAPDQTILFVEDDPEVRKSGLLQLSTLGYRTIEAATPLEALAALEGPARVDLLFTDVMLGGEMNGGQLAERAHRLRPGLKVLFASGYSENVIVRDGLLKPGVQLLRKPYRRAELARKLSELLSARKDA